MSNWTEEQVVALAPDQGSVKSGRGLAQPQKWLSLGATEHTLWGECQGSGKNPYQTEIDLTEPAFKCSCPSRKFPCKHALGLFFAYLTFPETFTASEPPAWVNEWLASRTQRAEVKAKKAEEQAEKPVDRKAQAKRAAKREENVQAGLQELTLHLHDLVRNGLAQPQCHAYQYWDDIAARMVDTQAPGIARLLRQMPGVLTTGDARYARALQQIARLHLLIEGYRRIETLPSGVQDEIRGLIGWTAKQEELLLNPGVRDRWLVVGRRVDEEDRLRVLRTWLYGLTTERPALLLSFAAAGQALDTTLPPGMLVDAALVFYPGNLPMRAIVKERYALAAHDAVMPGVASIDALCATYSAALARNPWLESYPAMLQQVICFRHGEQWVIRDQQQAMVPVHPRCTWGWDLLAISGGHPCWVMGEWDGATCLPLSCWADGRLTNFA